MKKTKTKKILTVLSLGALLWSPSGWADPAIPIPTEIVDRSTDVNGLFINHDDMAYLAANQSGLVIYDVSDPEKPVYQGRYKTSGYAEDVTVVSKSGDGTKTYAYVVESEDGLEIIDVTDPASTFLVGSYTFTSWDYYASEVAVNGNYAYVSAQAELLILDISDPTLPTLETSIDVEARGGMVIDGNYLYLAADSDGLVIVDISDPTTPEVLSATALASDATDVKVDGDYAYLSIDEEGMTVVDISDLSAPEVVGFGSCGGPSSDSGEADATHLDVKDDFIYLSCENNGISILDISDPTDPELTDYYDTSANAQDIQVVDGYAFVADYRSFQVFDVSDATDIDYITKRKIAKFSIVP